MNIGLIFPNKDRRYKTIHLGLAYIAAYARTQYNNLSFKVLDTRVASKKETKEFFNTNFDLVGITVFSPVYSEVKNIFHRLKQKDSQLPVCLGGPYVTTIMQDIFIETPAEYAVYGEGEYTFSHLLSHLKGNERIENINGLMYRNSKNEIITNPHRERIKDLDQLPAPAYDIFPVEKYTIHRLVTGRGCPYACAWCNSSSIWENGYYAMSPEKMISEIEYLITNYKKKTVVIGDNTFNSNLERLDKFCDLLIERKINIYWSASVRADNITPEIAQKMKKAGCYNVAIGIESANNKILEKIGKKTTIEKITEGIRMLKNAKIEIMSQYVIGSPFDTLDTIKESIAYARSSGCDFTNFYTVLPFKGTHQWEYILKYGKMYTEKIHNFHTIEPRIVFETPEFSYKERLKAIKLVKKEGFYSNKDKKSIWFDFAKESSRIMQNIFPDAIGGKIYMILKSIYRIKFFKKNNL